ncbi:unnamed protein product [Chondrus crispus]|uniref:Pre-mRNA-processing factor 17 n=1 Tax=Chondrus crispus TaxID=2769 RepID=R7QJ34_CHOCR|nr:unnamed protein product [Chondrus crispus]CDF38099.1 unnamed protein product [Chondrus crispus]|eukprot:XP_005717968.1 unnamed protein product [Chondrus crispus]
MAPVIFSFLRAVVNSFHVRCCSSRFRNLAHPFNCHLRKSVKYDDRATRSMDLLGQYTTVQGVSVSDSSSGDEAGVSPAAVIESKTPPPATKKKIVTGIIEAVEIDAAEFNANERRFAARAVAVDTATRNAAQQRPGHRPDDCKNDKPAESSRKQAPRKRERSSSPKPSAKKLRDQGPLIPTSTFHANEAKDYQGRSWVMPSGGARTFADLEEYTPYIPKRCARELKGAHVGGVSVVRFFPEYGHLLLSAGMDGKARVWRTSSGKLVRDYCGHSKTIRDVCFSNDGRRFLTASYDATVKLWDTETGRVVGSFTTGAAPSCVKFNPEPEKQNEFLAGCANRKILQIDVRNANEVVQEYDQHMGAVNSISFVEDNTRFVSSADDKVLRVWDYGIPVVIKYVSDPLMHSMPVTVLHPNRKWLACQSMDNKIAIYSARDRFKHNTKKRYGGHLVAGYACGLTFSGDGRFIGSGDSLGRLFFWDWKSSRLFRTLQGHKGVCIGLEWHPTKPSLVVSCGWDGDIKFWD